MKNLQINISRWAICLSFIFSGSLLKAQETIVTYVKKNGGHTAHKDSAAYTSILRMTPNEEGLYALNDYYPNGTLKRHGWVKDVNPQRLRFEGVVETYYDNGELETVTRYADARQIDTAERYYRNGVLREREVYLNPIEEKINSQLKIDLNKRLVYYADSTGNVQVRDGNGEAEITYAGGDIERGRYTGGLREGRWEGTFRKARYQFEEWYENGEVIRGISTDSLGKQYPYEQWRVQPEYPNGIQNLRQFIGKNYRYPKNAIQAKAKGQLVIRFVVDTTGIPTEFEVVNDMGYGTAHAAINVIKKAQRWSPGYERGIPARVKYTLPIRLDLSNSQNKKPASASK